MWKISHANLVMLLAAIPTYEPEEKKPGAKGGDDEIQDLRNFLNFE